MTVAKINIEKKLTEMRSVIEESLENKINKMQKIIKEMDIQYSQKISQIHGQMEAQAEEANQILETTDNHWKQVTSELNEEIMKLKERMNNCENEQFQLNGKTITSKAINVTANVVNIVNKNGTNTITEKEDKQKNLSEVNGDYLSQYISTQLLEARNDVEEQKKAKKILITKSHHH